MVKKTKITRQEVKIESKLVILSVLAGILGYFGFLALTYNLLIQAIFFLLLIRNFKKIQGMSIFIYYMIFNMVSMPLLLASMNPEISSLIVTLTINVILILLIIAGIKKLKSWGFYLTIIILVFALINSITYYRFYNSGILKIMEVGNYLFSIVLIVSFIVYLVKSKKYFKK